MQKTKNNMRGRNKLLFLITSLFLFSIFSFAYSVHAEGIAPVTDSNFSIVVDQLRGDNIINKTVRINASVITGTAGVVPSNYSRAQVYLISLGSTANTTLILINGSLGTNVNLTNNITIAINSSLFEDGNDYNITVSFWNGTTFFNMSKLIVIDNGVPTSATGFAPTGTVTNGTLNFTASVTNANTHACYLNFSGSNPGRTGYAMNYSGTSCSLFFRTPLSAFTYRWFISASDGSNTTASGLQTTTIDVVDDTLNSITTKQVKEVARQRELSVGGGVADSDVGKQLFEQDVANSEKRMLKFLANHR